MHAPSADDIRHDRRHGLFELLVDGHRAHLEYRRRGDELEILHTVVPTAIGGRGIAGRLVQAAVAHAREEGARIASSCSYATAWLERHPQPAAPAPPASGGTGR